LEQHLSSSQINVVTPVFAGVTTHTQDFFLVIPAKAGIQASWVVFTMRLLVEPAQ